MSFAVTKKVSDIASDVKRTFGDESGVQVTDSDIIRWVNQAQAEIVSKNNILYSTAVTQSVANQYVYSLAQLNIQAIRSIHFDGIKMENLTFQEAEEKISRDDPKHTAVGTPQYWYQWGNSDVMLYPTPANSDLAITIYYHATPATVSTTEDSLGLPDNYYNRILEYVMSCAYEMDENFAASDSRLSRFENNLVGMYEDENKPAQDFYATISVRPEDM
jgi:hypothetical protein